MKNSTLPIYHLALLRGKLLQAKADQEAFDSLDALYHSAVKGEAIERISGDNIEKLEIKIDPVIVEKAAESAQPETAAAYNGKTESDGPESLPSPSAAGTPMDEYRNQPTENVDLTMDEAKRRFPHFAEIIDDTFSPAPPIESTLESVNNASEEINIFPFVPLKILPADIETNSKWPAESILYVFNEREKETPTDWNRIGMKLGKNRAACEMKYYKLKKDGSIALMRETARAFSSLAEASVYNPPLKDHIPDATKMVDKAVTPRSSSQRAESNNAVTDTGKSAASNHSSQYAGKRDDKTLRDSDWPDIRHRYHGLHHPAEDIARDYQVPKNHMENFIRLRDAEEAELPRTRMGEKMAPA